MLQQAESSVVIDFTHTVASGVLDVPVGAAGQAAAGPGDGVGLGAVEGGDFQSQAAPEDESEAVQLHGAEGLILTVGDGVFGVAGADAAE